MSNGYLGTLDYADPLYEVLTTQVCREVEEPRFHVSSTSSRRVYKYTEEKTQRALIGKFFHLQDAGSDRMLRLKAEYDNLRKIRGFGFDSSPHYVVRPFARHEAIGLAVVEEYIEGKPLDHFFKRAAFRGDGPLLKEKLSALASFLFALHTRTATALAVDLEPVEDYFIKVLDSLYRHGIVTAGEERTFLMLMDAWLEQPLLRRAERVIVHGDATPTNFLFTGKGEVVAIDLERMRESDAAIDVSMICGELKHAFLWRTGSAAASEPFIGHFLEAYARHSPDPQTVFHRFTARNPFYMALTELRIARNSYLDRGYRRRLVAEAMACLDGGLGRW
ncbi:MAG: aminoglycoside phosphotransferase family protein [Nitrospirota bacterium]